MKSFHVFAKGRSGWGIFYQREDCLVYLTLFSVLARRFGLSVIAFNLMFNHTHALVTGVDKETIVAFQSRLACIFAIQYNKHYRRSGPLFHHSFGCSCKTSTKSTMGSVAYVFNNPVAGRLCRTAKDGRWSLLAYRDSPCPFSGKIRRDRCRKILRRALQTVDMLHRHGKPLNYSVVQRLFEPLEPKEKEQLTDYIIAKYNFLDYAELERLYGSFGKVLTAIDANAGSEYDLEDEYGDHTCYRKMIAFAKKRIRLERICSENLTAAEIQWLVNDLHAQTGAKQSNIAKFLHLER